MLNFKGFATGSPNIVGPCHTINLWSNAGHVNRSNEKTGAYLVFFTQFTH